MQTLTSAEWMSNWGDYSATGFDMTQVIAEDDQKGRQIADSFNIPYEVVETEFGQLAKLPTLVWELVQ